MPILMTRCSFELVYEFELREDSHHAERTRGDLVRVKVRSESRIWFEPKDNAVSLLSHWGRRIVCVILLDELLPCLLILSLIKIPLAFTRYCREHFSEIHKRRQLLILD